MRVVALLPMAVLAAGCWTPGPGELDPARYPWDQIARPRASYCIVSLETGSGSGITTKPGDAVHLACQEPNEPR